MTVPANISDSTAIHAALDQELVKNFQGEADRLAEILGIFGAETIAAGTALKMLKVGGALNDSKTAATKVGATGTGDVTLGSSSGTAYVEGDEVALSKFTAEYETVGEATLKPYRKMTTANAIQKSGLEAAVLKTDQTVFGMTYLESFLGMTSVFLTNKVAKGTMYATAAENLHVYGIDFATIASAGLAYATDANGLIGVAHTPAYDHVSVDTNVLSGMLLFPEVKDYIAKGTVSAK